MSGAPGGRRRSPQRVLAAALLVALATFASSWAQVDGDGAEPPPTAVVQERLVVTATRIEQREREVPVAVTVLDASQLARSAALSVDDVLRQVPGFSLFRRSSSLVAHPTTQGVSLRGIGPSGVSRTLVLLDGVPLNDPFGGWVYWSRVPRAELERVEIVRGGGSSVWGNYALGGVIQLITATPKDGFANLLLELGERDTRALEVGAGRRLGDSLLSLRASYFDTAGYPVIASPQRGPIDIPARSEHGALGGRTRFELGAGGELSLGGDYFSEDRGNGTPLTANDTDALFFDLHASRRLVAAGDLDLAVFYQRQDFASTFSAQSADRRDESPALDQFLVDSEALGLSVQWTRPFAVATSSHTLSLGSDLRRIDGATHEDFRNLGAGFTRRRRAGGEQQLGGLFAQDNIAVGARWQINLGARVDRWRSRDGERLERDLSDGTVTLAAVFPDRAANELSPKLALRYAVSERLSLRGSLYRAFRAPTINELFRPFRVRNDITEANAELVPERLSGAELSLDYRRPAAAVRLTGFVNELDDPVANVTLGLGPGVVLPCGFVPGGGICRQRQNLTTARIRGVEAEVSVRPTASPWSGSLSYLYTRPEVTRAPNQLELEGRRIAQVPAHQLVARLEHLGRRWQLALQGRWASEQFEDDLNSLALAELVVVDLFVGRDLGAHWQLFAAVENVLDRTIETGLTADGLQSIGVPRLLHGGLRWRLR